MVRKIVDLSKTKEKRSWPKIKGYIVLKNAEIRGVCYCRVSGLGTIDSFLVTPEEVKIIGETNPDIKWEVKAVGFMGGKVFCHFLSQTIEEIADQINEADQ